MLEIFIRFLERQLTGHLASRYHRPRPLHQNKVHIQHYQLSLFVFCKEELFGGLTRNAETVTNLGGLPSVWVQQLKSEGLGKTEGHKEGDSFPSTTWLSQTGQWQSPTYLMLSVDLLEAQLLQRGVVG